MPQDPPSDRPEASTRLDSWKEIAAYLKRDVTTVRRWEKREGLPVHRHQHDKQGSVYALIVEIDAWREGRTHRAQSQAPPALTLQAVVGRDAELGRLRTNFNRALAGTRRVVFVAGELGLGKTALTRTFVDSVSGDVWVAAGQCVEQYGAAEPYLPFIESLERLCREPGNSEAVAIVADCAPSWLGHIALPSRGRRRQSGHAGGVTPERMASELTDAVETLAAVKPLVLLLEDLHWSDHSTVELIARLGRRPDPARLLVIGTYRPAELFDSGSPLLRVCRELRAHFQADEIELSPLTQDAVAKLITRDRTWTDPRGAAACLRRWSGNPLFLVHVLTHLESSGRLVERNGEWTLDLESQGVTGVPGTLRTLLEEQVDRLGPDTRRLLEIASVAGEEFPAAIVAPAAGQDVSTLERSLDDFCRRSHLVTRRSPARWPDGTESACYGFVHDFYRQVIYDRLPSATVAAFHQCIGERLERAYGDRAGEIASELATHFDRGHVAARAVRYCIDAAENALARSADREAQVSLSRAFEMAALLPRGDERVQVDERLRVLLGSIARARSASIAWMHTAENGSPELMTSLNELSRIQAVSGDLRTAREISDRAVAGARLRNSGLFEAMGQQAWVCLLAGEFAASRSLALEALKRSALDAVPKTHPDAIRCAAILAWSTWYLGRCEELSKTLEPMVMSEEDPAFSAAGAATATQLKQLLVQGRLLIRRGGTSEGVERLQGCEQTLRRLGMIGWLPITLAWLAEGYQKNGLTEKALTAAEDGLNLVRRTGMRCYDVELYRLRGEAMMRSRKDDAEASFWAGITVARQQDARMLELRVTLSLARLLLASGRDTEARQVMAPVCESFPAGLDVPELEEARKLVRQGS